MGFFTRVHVRAASHVNLVVAELCCGTPCQLPAERDTIDNSKLYS